MSGILRNRANPSKEENWLCLCKTGGGCLAPAYIQLSKIVVAEPLARMLPLLRHCAELARMGFCETEPIPTAPSVVACLLLGISLARVVIAAFGVVFGLALVSVAYGEKIIEKTCECFAGG